VSTSITDTLRDATRRLTEAGIDGARLDARVLLAHLLGVAPGWLVTHSDEALDPDRSAAFAASLARRLDREPVARILGEQEFWSLPFQVTADTLIPRPDSETLVDAVLCRLPDRSAPLRLLDLGTGTGCLLLALLHELPNAWGLAVDRNAGAARVAAANARALGLSERTAVICGDWGTALDGFFDAILSNPPYIPDRDIADLQPEVSRFEPRPALAGGADGYQAYRRLAPELARLLAPGGFVALEVGQGQASQVAAIVQAHGLTAIEIHQDLAGVDRCVMAAKTGKDG